jgi:DivIVA domain-containing protein
VARKRKKDDEAAESAAERTDASGERTRLTPADVQQKVFRLAFRGYNERDVDEFLDRITGELAALHEDNKRLREQLAEGGGGTDASGAERQAETIVRQAREHAARLVEDAERRASMVGPAVPAELPGSFLLEERRFLQQMASLIQDHAQRLKDEARRSRAPSDQAEKAEAPREAGPPATTGTLGAAAVAAGAAVASSPPEPSSESFESPPPEPSPPPAPEPSPTPPEEATSPWAPVGDEPSPPRQEPSGSGEQGDQLVSAWESAFTGDAGEPAFADERARRENEGEPSLRELFWGEE